MLNQTVIVGRLTKDPELKTLEDGKERCVITVAVPRSYKNEEGVYESDFIDCTLWNNIAANTTEYCRKGDMVGIKGRLQTSTYEAENGEMKKSFQLIADKVTFLSSKARDVDVENTKEASDDMEM